MKNYNEVSLNDTNNKKLLDNQSYQDYLRNDRAKITTNKRIKKFLSNNTYCLAVKQLSDLEKSVFYLAILKNEKLDHICRLLKLSRKDIVKIRKSAIKHFVANVKDLKKDNNKID